MAACFATVLRIKLEDVFDYCNHDGSYIAWGDLPEPQCRIGFHTQEMISLALAHGYFVTPVARGWYTARANRELVAMANEEKAESRFHSYLRNYYGVMYFRNDLIAVWDGLKILDPVSGKSYEYTDQEVDVLFIVGKICNHQSVCLK